MNLSHTLYETGNYPIILRMHWLLQHPCLRMKCFISVKLVNPYRTFRFLSPIESILDVIMTNEVNSIFSCIFVNSLFAAKNRIEQRFVYMRSLWRSYLERIYCRYIESRCDCSPAGNNALKTFSILKILCSFDRNSSYITNWEMIQSFKSTEIIIKF